MNQGVPSVHPRPPQSLKIEFIPTFFTTFCNEVNPFIYTYLPYLQPFHKHTGNDLIELETIPVSKAVHEQTEQPWDRTTKMMSTSKLVSAARPPLPPCKKAASFSVPMACHPSVRSNTQTPEGTKYGFSSITAHQPSKTARPSPSPPALSHNDADMLPRSNEISCRDITAARTLLGVQSCVRSHSVDIADVANVRDEVLPRNAETPHPTTGMAAACVRTRRNATSSPRVEVTQVAPICAATTPPTSATCHKRLVKNVAATRGAAICDAGSLRIGIESVTRGVAALRISVVSHQVHDVDAAAPCSQTNRSARKRRLDAPTSERPAKRARVQATRSATKEAVDAGKGRPSNEMQSGRKRKRCGETSGAPLRKKRRVTAFVTEMRYDPMEVC